MCRKIRYDEKFKKKLQNFWEVNKALVFYLSKNHAIKTDSPPLRRPTILLISYRPKNSHSPRAAATKEERPASPSPSPLSPPLLLIVVAGLRFGVAIPAWGFKAEGGMKSPLRRFRGFAHHHHHHHHHRERKDHRPPPAKLDELTYAAQVSSPRPERLSSFPTGYCRAVASAVWLRAKVGSCVLVEEPRSRPPLLMPRIFMARVDRSDLFLGHGDFLGSNDLR